MDSSKLDTRVMTSQEVKAQVLRAIAFAVFQDYLESVDADEFARRFGTLGSECLAKFWK